MIKPPRWGGRSMKARWEFGQTAPCGAVINMPKIASSMPLLRARYWTEGLSTSLLRLGPNPLLSIRPSALRVHSYSPQVLLISWTFSALPSSFTRVGGGWIYWLELLNVCLTVNKISLIKNFYFFKWNIELKELLHKARIYLFSWSQNAMSKCHLTHFLNNLFFFRIISSIIWRVAVFKSQI